MVDVYGFDVFLSLPKNLSGKLGLAFKLGSPGGFNYGEKTLRHLREMLN